MFAPYGRPKNTFQCIGSGRVELAPSSVELQLFSLLFGAPFVTGASVAPPPPPPPPPQSPCTVVVGM
ncbi:uncharacterized protein K489DRAFT_382610 [Dissoconium aciculare CBS 342.82]|uniref:Uncharacterized protein n=1 Tax=Dissoconium aciculare CBS 342.82 TaxID=1314786 RepID=A0A6J3LY42_9PEZI|nr:uncharacterized protein K489DRAFT_382610 [Dissoconium aciculare CBS 342.82]KAF1820676.1 hypothetical protein K489DRAFT_382610 [Dissoconium aciculare CBS 342.82]